MSRSKHRNGGARPARAPTLKDVAEAAGVSVGVASRVLGAYGSFSDATRVRVSEAARALGYRPNGVARSLRTGRTMVLGLAVTNLASFHWIRFVQGVEAAAASHGYQVILGHTGDDPARERDHIRALVQRNVDGLIIAPTRDNEPWLEDLVAAGFPVVLTESACARILAPCINIADHRAAYEATAHLVRVGHRRIAMVAGDPALASGADRLRGYQDALRDHGVTPDDGLIGVGGYRFGPALAATRSLMGSAEPPTALVVANETMLGAAVTGLRELGLRIADDVALVALDDPPWAAFFSPAITSVRAPRERMGAMAVDALLGMIAAGPTRAAVRDVRVVACELVVRESCRLRR